MHSSGDRLTLQLPLTEDVLCARLGGARSSGNSQAVGRQAHPQRKAKVPSSGVVGTVSRWLAVSQNRVRSPCGLALSLRRDEGVSHAHLGWCP